jgi:hypothetical protein
MVCRQRLCRYAQNKARARRPIFRRERGHRIGRLSLGLHPSPCALIGRRKCTRKLPKVIITHHHVQRATNNTCVSQPQVPSTVLTSSRTRLALVSTPTNFKPRAQPGSFCVPACQKHTRRQHDRPYPETHWCPHIERNKAKRACPCICSVAFASPF